MTSLRDPRPYLKPTQHRLLTRLQQAGPQSLVELCEPFQLSQVFAEQALEELRALGLATTDNGTVWRVGQ